MYWSCCWVDAFEPPSVECSEDRSSLVNNSGHLHKLPPSLLRDGADLVVPSAVVQNLGIFIVTDASMRSYVMRQSSRFAILYPTISATNRSSVADVVTRSRLNSVMPHCLASLFNVFNRWWTPLPEWSIHISPFLRQLHWLKGRERVDYKVAVLVFKCLHGTGPAYLADELSHSFDFESRRRLRSASSLNLNVRRTRLST